MTELSSSAAMNTLQALSASLGEDGDKEKEALVSFSREKPDRWTYDTLARRIEALAGGLSAAGVGRQSRVVVIGSNRPPWVLAVLAVLRVGGIVVPVDPQMSDDVLGHILEHSDPSLVLAGEAELERVRSHRPDTEIGILSLADEAAGGERNLQSWMKRGDETAFEDVTPEDTAVLFYCKSLDQT